MTLLSAMVFGAGYMEGCDVLRLGQATAVLGHGVSVPPTLGTFLPSFSFGRVR